VLVAYQMVTYLTDRDRELVETVRQTLADLDAARESLEATSVQLEALRAEASAAAMALERQQEARRERLRAIDLEAEDTRLALADAEDNERALTRTLSRLAIADTEALGEQFAAARGGLPWPAVGEVVGGFGRRRHPIYDTYTVSRGIEIGAPEGDPVTAVFAGRVAFADWYKGYGLLVILDHGGDYFTLYAHLREVSVRVGDSIEPGALLGRVGETASLTGPNLYFEVREGTDALNPLQWLDRR
jgi:murein DD-endopeptidase MepM/ murein hydrolase activator NlpD